MLTVKLGVDKSRRVPYQSSATASLKGQSVQLACVSDATEEQDYIEMVQVSGQVAYQRKHDGEIICTYLAGNNKHRLKLWGEWLGRSR